MAKNSLGGFHMNASKGQIYRFSDISRHKSEEKIWRWVKKGIAFMAGGCMLLSSMELTVLAAGKVPGIGVSMAEDRQLSEDANKQEGMYGHIEGADAVFELEMLAEEGHIHTPEEHDGWTGWNDAAKLPTSAGNYYLTVDVTLTALWTVPGGQIVNLCLNGHTIQQTKSSTGVIKVTGAGTELSVYDCSEGTAGMITGGKGSGSNGGGITVSSSGALNLHGGMISGNTATSGGGVYVTGGSAALYGGAVTGNGATSNGGGIYLAGSGSLTINGGSIENNRTTGTSGKGGGIYVTSGTADIYGGDITGNQAVSGGGIYATSASGKVNLNGGGVTGNTATGDGGGIYAAASSKMTINGGTIAANAASNKGGGIYYASNFSVNGGGIYNNIAGEEVNNLQVSSATSSYKAALNGGLILGGLMEAEKFYEYGSDMHSGSISGTIGDEIISRNGEAVAVLPGARPGDTLYASTAEEITSTADGRLYKAVYLPVAGADTTGTWDFRWVPEIGTEFTVTYHTNGGTIKNQANYAKYSYGTELSLPTAQEITREGQEFLGWYDNADLTGSPVTSIAADALFADEPVFYARWRESHACADCPAEHVAIADWVPWEDSSKLPDIADIPESTGSYYLTVDVELTAGAWAVPKGKTVNLCLNGHTIRQATAGAGVISIIGTGTELVVFDCSAGMTGMITGGKATATTAGGGVTVGSSSGSGSLKLYGGSVRGNEAPNGGGIYITSTNSTLLIDGGRIENNTATGTTSTSGRGGGIYAANGTVTLVDGGIAGNRGNYGGGVGVGGGSVEMFDGEITGNQGNNGGGVYTTGSSARFTINGGNITDNTTTGNGGGIHAATSSTPTINGGSIFGNKAAGNGGGIYGATAKMQITGGTISGNEADSEGGGIFYAANLTVSGGAIYANKAGGAVNNLSATSTGYTASLKGGLILGGLEGKGKYNYNSETYPMYAGEITGTIGNEIVSKEGEVLKASVVGARPGDILYADKAEEITSAADGRLYKGIYESPEGETGIGTWSFRWVPDIGAKYTVTYETGGGIIENQDRYTEYTYGSELLLPTEQEVSRDGYVFMGWYEKAECTGEPVTSIPADALLDGNPVFYAKWKEGHACKNCPKEHEAVGNWQEWEDSSTLPAAAGNYFLTADVELAAAWTVPEGVFNLCLNGHTVRQTKSYRVIMVGSTSELCIFDCSAQQSGKISGGKSSSSGAGIYVKDGTLKMYGGTVCENSYTGTSTTSGGGGISVDNGVMELYGGTVSGNKARSGGGVFLTNDAALKMAGGSITGNIENNSGARITNGGGVYVASGSVKLSGGSIEGNQAGNGGGLYMAGGSVELSGGSIEGNQADSGGGIYVGGLLQLSGGRISGNAAVNNGGGIYSKGSTAAKNGQIIMTGGSVYANTAGKGAGVYYDSYSTVSLTGGLILGALEGAARNVTCNFGTDAYPMYSGVIAGTVGDTVTDGTNTVSGAKAGDMLTASRSAGITVVSVSGGQPYTGVYMDSEDGIWQFRLPSEGIILNKSEAVLDYPENAELQLTAVVTDTSGGDATVTWRSSDDAVAAVSESGMVTANKTGTAVITAETGSGLTADCRITVTGSVYTVTYHLNGGMLTAEGNDADSYIYGTGLKLPGTVVREGHTFDGWFADAACTGGAVTEISVTETGNKEFYAKWTEVVPESPSPTPSPSPTLSPSPAPGITPTPGPSLVPGSSQEPGGNPEMSPVPEWNINGGQQEVEGEMWVQQPVIEVELPGNLDFGINPFKLAVSGAGENGAPITDQIISGEYYVTNYSNVAVAVTAATYISAADDKVALMAKDDIVWNTANELETSAMAGRKAVWLVQLYPTDIRVDDTGNSMTVTGITAGTTTGTNAAGDTLVKGGEADVVKRPVFVLAAWDETSNDTKKASIAGFQFGGAVDPGAAFEDGDITVTTVFELRLLTAAQADKNYEDYKTADGVTGFYSTIKQGK